MRSRFLLCALLPVLGTLASAMGAACSDDSPSDPGGELDSGRDVGPLPDAAPLDADAGKRDCSTDIQADGLAEHLECAGLYSDLSSKTLAPNVQPYRPAAEFWSDGAEKQRFVYLPPGSKIEIGGDASFDEWVYPTGIKLFKEFKLGGKRIETRLYTKTADGWEHTAYRWNADETDAVRKDGGERLAGLGPDGGVYQMPNTGQCNECHDGRVEPVLGFDAVSLGLPNAEGVTLAMLASEGRFDVAPPKTELALPNDDAGLARPAIAWVHANCGGCHNSNPTAAATFRTHLLVRASQLVNAPTVESLDLWAQAYCKDSHRTDQDAGGFYKMIRGGDPSKSLTAILSGQRSAPPDEPSSSVQMPPLVTRAVDHAGHKLFTDWIAALPPCP